MLTNPSRSRPPYPEVKCTACGWVHVALPLDEALCQCQTRDEIARYYRCFNCGKPTAAFVLAGPQDAPLGCTLQPVVVGVAPDALYAHGKVRTFYCESSPKNGKELLELIEYYVAHKPALLPFKFRMFNVAVEDEVLNAVLSAPDPLAAATALLVQHLDSSDEQESRRTP